MTGNNIGESGARMISESLKTNTTLTTLSLNGDEKWSKMKWIIIIIKKTKEWKNEMKNINDNENTEERWQMIKWKIWTGNNIGESGTRMISESLKTNTTLTVLNLSCDEKWSKMK